MPSLTRLEIEACPTKARPTLKTPCKLETRFVTRAMAIPGDVGKRGEHGENYSIGRHTKHSSPVMLGKGVTLGIAKN